MTKNTDSLNCITKSCSNRQSLDYWDWLVGSSRLRRGILGETEVCQEVGQQSMGWYMQGYSKTRRSWEDLYFFTEHEWREKDFEIPNLWCSTGHPLFCKVILQVRLLARFVISSIIPLLCAGYRHYCIINTFSTSKLLSARSSLRGAVNMTKARSILTDINLYLQELILAVQTLDGRRTLSGRKLRLIGSDKFEEQDVSGSTELESALEKYFGLPRFTSTESATNCQ